MGNKNSVFCDLGLLHERGIAMLQENGHHVFRISRLQGREAKPYTLGISYLLDSMYFDK